MAEIVRRRSWGGVLPLGRHVSISGSSFIQCASASIAPPHPGGAKCYPGADVQGRTGSSWRWPVLNSPEPLRSTFILNVPFHLAVQMAARVESLLYLLDVPLIEARSSSEE